MQNFDFKRPYLNYGQVTRIFLSRAHSRFGNMVLVNKQACLLFNKRILAKCSGICVQILLNL